MQSQLKVKVKERNIELNKMKTFDDLLVQQLQDEEFKKEYEAIQPEMNEIRARVDVRTSQEK